MEMIINNLRASVFTNSIPYSWELIGRLKEVLPDWLPSANRVLRPENADGPVPEWSLFSPDGKQILVAWQNKMDYVSVVDGKSELIGPFCETARRIFSSLLDYSKGKAYRFAIAPKYACANDMESIGKWMRGIFCKNQFEGSEIMECSYSQAYVVEKELNGTKIPMNFFTRFQPEQRETQRDGRPVVETGYFCEFDINSAGHPGSGYPVETLGAFFDEAPSYCKAFEEFYFGE